MKPTHLFVIVISLLITCCREKPKETSTYVGSTFIRNLNNREVSIDSINAFVKQKMEEMDIPGVSYSIINDGQLVYHHVLGYSNLVTKEPVNNATMF